MRVTGPMLQKLDERIVECLVHAEHCRQRAEKTTDLGTKEDFLKLERHWRTLAHSYELTGQLSSFTASLKAPRSE